MAVLPVIGVVIAVVMGVLSADLLKLGPLKNEKDIVLKPVIQPSLELLATIPRDHKNRLTAAKIEYGNQLFGPESVVFDSQGRGPYSGFGDGRVMRWDGPESGWVEFATVIPNRTEICIPPSPLGPNLRYEHLCGRPLGMRFDKRTGDLYICDSYFGLMVVGKEGGVAQVLTNEAEGVKFGFTNDLDVDDDGTIYFTDSSTKYPRSKFFFSILVADDNGRFLKYDPRTKETTVLMRGLQFPNGVTFNKDHSFVLLAETRVGRLLRYWVKGEKAGTVEHFMWLPGYPDNVRTNDKGEFWVALHCRRNSFERFVSSYTSFRKVLLSLPLSPKILYTLFSGKPHAQVLKYSAEGELLDVLEDQNGSVVTFVSEAEEHDGKLYLGSVLLPHVAVVTL